MNPPLSRWLRRTVIRTITLVCTQAGWTTPLAMPPHPDLLERAESGRLSVPACDRDAGTPLHRERAARLHSRRAGGAAVDTFQALAILIHYSDLAGATPAADFDTLLYQTAAGSVRDFYRECSYGRLDLVTVDLPSATGWKAAPQSQNYYANGEHGLGASSYPNNARRLVEDAVAAADAGVDFSRYDNDGDGWVDVLMVVHSGPGAEFTGDLNDIWSHKWSIAPQQRDGVFLAPYTMMPEYWSNPGDMTIGVFAHELGHAFGLPDLYDTDYSSRGVGRWSVMAGGAWNGLLGNSPAHFDAWCKIQLGFLTPVTPVANAIGVPVPQVETDSVVYRLWDGGAAGDEYFLVENRQRTGFDAGLPTSGMLIWHIDDGVSTDNDKEWYPGNTGSGHYLVALEQADGLWQLEQSQNSGNSGDVFPGSTGARQFNSTTLPNSLAYDGSVSFVSVSNISNSDSLMTADFSVSLASGLEEDVRPRAHLASRVYPNPFNAGTHIEAEMSAPGWVRLDIYNLLGHRVKSYESAHAAGTWRVTWDGTDQAGQALSSGVYAYRLRTGLASTHGRMVMIK